MNSPKTDTHTTLAELRAVVQDFVSARSWEPFHTPKNLTMSIAIEAAELMEHFQWTTPEEGDLHMQDSAFKAEVAGELADVLIYCLAFANQTGLDISQIITATLHRNQARFPTQGTPGIDT